MKNKTSIPIFLSLLFLALPLPSMAQDQLEAPDDFAEFETPSSTVSTPTAESSNLENIGDPNPLDVIENKTATTPADSKNEALPNFDELKGEKDKPATAQNKTATTPPPPTIIEPPKSEPVPLPLVEEKKPTEVAPPLPPPPPAPEKIEKKAEVLPPPPRVLSEPKIQALIPGKDIDVSKKSEPNFNLERRLHEIYKKYNEQPTNAEVWENVVGARAFEVYKIQKGDTLWDLSQTFFGDPNYWPKVWSLNKDSILNPHQVDPQMSVRFYPGSTQEAPTLGLLTRRAVDEDYVPSANSETEPPLIRKKEQVLELVPGAKIPDSLPLYRLGQVHQPKTEFIETVEPNQGALFPAYLQFKIVDQFPSGAGIISETETGLNSASEFQYVFVKMDADPQVKLYTAVSQKRKISGGHQAEIQGSIEIIEKVNDRKNLYKALVRKQIAPITVGSTLVPGAPPTFDLKLHPVSPTKEPLPIIGGSDLSGNLVLGKNSYVFLRGGKSLGLTSGQVLSVFQNQTERNPKSQVEFLSDIIGYIKLVDVSDSYSTGIVVKSLKNIKTGDWVGANGVARMAQKSDFGSFVTSGGSADSEFQEDFLETSKPDSTAKTKSSDPTGDSESSKGHDEIEFE